MEIIWNLSKLADIKKHNIGIMMDGPGYKIILKNILNIGK